MSDQTPEGGRYPHVVKAVTETPWAAEPHVLAAIREMVAMRAHGERFSEEEIQARIGSGPARRDMQMAGSVAVLPLHGVITPRADLFTEMSGGTSVQRFQAAFRAAVSDKDVKAIVMDVNSPGGMTDMIPELAAEIRGARGKKPIVAVASTKAASAAYWLAAQADEIVVTQSGSVGSVGVFAAHDDISGALEQAGVKTTLISAGKFKTEGNPFEPLSDEAKAAIQARVDEMYGMFTADVAKGRRVPVGDVRGGFGEGRMVTAKQAVKAGMADRVDTLQATVERLANGQAKLPSDEPPDIDVMLDDDEASSDTPDLQAAHSGLSFADETSALHDSAVALTGRLASLAEVQRGHLTVSKRERLTACTGALADVVTELNGLLEATDPDKHRVAVEREFLRYERQRASL